MWKFEERTNASILSESNEEEVQLHAIEALIPNQSV